jgi:DNA-binding response OmpR family regulator
VKTELYRTPKILLVDNDEYLLKPLSDELTSFGYHISTAIDGDEAISHIKKSNYDLILLDIKMPKVDGFEVLRYVKKYFPAIKVIMLTGYADVTNALESKKLGADDFIGKPYDVEELNTSMKRLLVS